jgi:hypothetical protein
LIDILEGETGSAGAVVGAGAGVGVGAGEGADEGGKDLGSSLGDGGAGAVGATGGAVSACSVTIGADSPVVGWSLVVEVGSCAVSIATMKSYSSLTTVIQAE